MDKYEQVRVVGEGSYGLVVKCRHKETKMAVAIKKFVDTEKDATVKKIALREIRMLKRLRHENLINLIEVFRRKRRLFIVTEFVDHTLLDELEEKPNGLDANTIREHIFQVLRALDFCHRNNVLHRDIKPENVLVSRLGVIKVCDFGFARLAASTDETYTDYVATRWYRSPELLVGDPNYGREVDVWAAGCLFFEMCTGQPLFAGSSDLDQLFLISERMHGLTLRQRQLLARNKNFSGLDLSELLVKRRFDDDDDQEVEEVFTTHLSQWPRGQSGLLDGCLSMEPTCRWSAQQALDSHYFTHDLFNKKFIMDIRNRVHQEFGSPLDGVADELEDDEDEGRKERVESKRETWRRDALFRRKSDAFDHFLLNNNNDDDDHVLNNSKLLPMASMSRAQVDSLWKGEESVLTDSKTTITMPVLTDLKSKGNVFFDSIDNVPAKGQRKKSQPISLPLVIKPSTTTTSTTTTSITTSTSTSSFPSWLTDNLPNVYK